MSTFWSVWIIVLTVITFIGTLWILFANLKVDERGDDATTGHVYDGIEEYDNPLPAWWLYLFLITIVYGAVYLLAYPGLGSYQGFLGWSSTGQWEEEQKKAEQTYGAIFAKYAATPIEQLTQDPKALRMGRRMFANNCAQCHGSDARGSMGFPNLANGHWIFGGSPATISQTITQGRQTAMPPWGSILGEQGVRDVSAYVISLSGAKVDQQLAAAGKPKFKTYCVACHGADGKGNKALGAANFTDGSWLYGGSMGDVMQTVENGRNGKMPAFGGELGADKIHLLAAYVYSLSPPDKK